MLSSSVVASPLLFDDFREEIKDMAVKNHTAGHTYSKARQHIMQNIHLREDQTGYYVFDVYCKVRYRKKVGPHSMPNHQKINIEHTWPRSRFGVKKGSSAWRLREADLHHLYPTDSRANSIRGNHKFNQFKPGVGAIKDCPFSKRSISSNGELAFEPPQEHKGNVARALFYFAVRYDMRISQAEEMVLKQWNLIDPVDTEERERNDDIERIQGNRNPFIDDAALVDLISDF